MSEPDVRPPSFLRRHLAANTDRHEILVGLACDESMWVRRQAVQNPATPRWVLDLLERAGADRDLRGRRDPDPDMTPSELRLLVECGPWAQQLVADHPKATAEILDALAPHANDRIRRAVAEHVNTAPATLARLCADGDDEVRRSAATHPSRPFDALALMQRAGADPELAGLGQAVDDTLDPDELVSLARLGPWGRFLAGRHASCPSAVLAEVAGDPDWRVRSAVLDNPEATADLIDAVAGSLDDDVTGDVCAPYDPEAGAELLIALAGHPHAEVRLAAARHPNADADIIRMLAVDRVADIRRSAARHSLMDPDELSLLVRAGSTCDLARLAAPHRSVTSDELDELARGGYWARQLAVRHPGTAPATLGRLLCDDDPKLREWAAAHSSVPTEVVDLLRRAGAAQDFQGIAEADPAMSLDDLERVAQLGPYGALIVSWHPNAPEGRREPRNRPQENSCLT